MTIRVAAWQHGIHPRSESLVAATRDLERGRTTPEKVENQLRADVADFVATQQAAGLDVLSDGLLWWPDIFRPLVDATSGMQAHALVRWFDNNAFYRAPEVHGPLALARDPATLFARFGEAPVPRLASLPSPYLFARVAQATGDRDQLIGELARHVIAPVAATLPGLGYQVIQLQEPWLTYHGIASESWEHLERALGVIQEAVGGRAVLVLHTYFGDAAPYADRLRRLPVDAIGIDLVATDLDSLGAGWDVGVLVGCLDGRRSLLEDAEQTVAAVRRVAELLDPPALYLSSGSDLELLPRAVAQRKVLRLGEVARGVREELA
jgi:5-methyltetrahydropteroyltriglutamate--homocysteine methyltransferase